MAQNTSFIRWAGGKSWLVPFVKELIGGLEFNNYHEPFMGGAAVFFAIDVPGRSFLSDLNRELVYTFCAVRDNPTRLRNYLREFNTDEDSYYTIRQTRPIGKYQRAARFIYLNTYSYNGLYRENKNGEYNVPYGHNENATINYDRIMVASEKLRNAEIVCRDFVRAGENIQRGDLVFLDPPYTVSKKQNEMFNKYNSKLFSLEDQERLGEMIDLINDRGAFYILTNAAHDAIYNIFHNRGRIIQRERNSLIGGKEAFRGKVQEYIFTNIPER